MTPNNRILIVDDNASIHEDFRKALCLNPLAARQDRLVELEKMLFNTAGTVEKPPPGKSYILHTATQGKQAYKMVSEALEKGEPYAMAFVDVRMPPGWDGVQTASKMLAADPFLEIVLCSAFSDYSWEKIVGILGETDRILFLHKPFAVVEVKQMALALTRKWALNHENQETQAILREGREQAEAVSREKSLFLSNMSHEIRTPLNGVIGMANLLSKTMLNGEQTEYVSGISYSAEMLLDLINDILDFSKIEAGKLIIENIDFDIRGLLEDVRGVFAFQFEEAGLDLTSSCPDNMPSQVRGDPIRIRQILVNLMANALKFTETGGVHVQLEMEAEPSGQGYRVEFSIIDTGIGISEEGIKRLFKVFSQVDSSTSRKHGGTGLGLSISHLLAKNMGGMIGVRSELGEGSKFWFNLHVDQASTPTAPLTLDKKLEGLRVLVLQPENATNDRLLTFLDGWGCLRFVTTKVETAFTHLREKEGGGEAIQVMLVDQENPAGTDEPLFTTHEANPEFADLVKIKLVERTLPGDVHLIRHQGFAGFLTKPVDEKELYGLLTTWHDERQQQEMALVPPEQVRILVAEDNPVNQKVVTRMLKTGGYDSDLAKDGYEVLSLLAKQHYDLILMDCQMPGMDGFQASRLIRKHEGEAWLAKIPILAVTANAVKGDREKCLKAGMNEYITKPIRQDELLKKVANWLARSHEQKIGEADAIES